MWMTAQDRKLVAKLCRMASLKHEISVGATAAVLRCYTTSLHLAWSARSVGDAASKIRVRISLLECLTHHVAQSMGSACERTMKDWTAVWQSPPSCIVARARGP
jgi:hypothetical protein